MNKIDFEKIEKKWRKRWEGEPGLYKAKDEVGKKKYVLVEFPYCSGEGLHIGHAFTNTGGDVYARFKRMQGENVLFPMGWDSFGLPTENYAVKTGIQPQVITDRNTGRFKKQNKELAQSFDWSREIDTSDPHYYRWTQWIFLKFFKHGLAYKGQMPINWCPSCKIGLANEEVVDGKCERCGAEAGKKKLSQWILRITKYADRLADELDLTEFPESVKASQRNWIGRKQWIDIVYDVEATGEKIVVSTTRPDTNFGATFVVVAPEHELVGKIISGGLKVERKVREELRSYVDQTVRKSELERLVEGKKKTGVFTGLYAVNQLTGKKMPIWVTDFVLGTVGTGAVVGVPGHDKRDFEFAKTFGLEIVRVVVGADGDKSEIMRLEQVQEAEGTMINSDFLNGMDVRRATEKIMDYLEKKGWGKKTMRYHLRDWIFSRQHYWGEPIPLVFCKSCAKEGVVWKGYDFKIGKVKTDDVKKCWDSAGWFPVKEEDLPVELPKVKKYEPTDTGESPLAAIGDWVEVKCPHCGRKARRETDTMPNWAGSSWYYLAFLMADELGKRSEGVGEIFKKNRERLAQWMPVDVYVGGDEHTTLHLLYSRFWHKVLNDLGLVPGKEPYKKRVVHGVVLGQDRQRMSKSRGNVVNPSKVTQKYGVDVLRLYLMFMMPFEGTGPWNEKTLAGVRRFLIRFSDFINFIKRSVGNPKAGLEMDYSQLKPLLHKTVKKVSEDIEQFKFNTAIAAIMECLNSFYELSLKRQTEEKKKWLSLSKSDAGLLVRLLAPFAPYMAEELWEKLGNKGSVHRETWPSWDEKYLVEEEVEIPVSVDGKLRSRIRVESIKVDDKSYVLGLAKNDKKVRVWIENKKVVGEIYVPGRMVNLVLK